MGQYWRVVNLSRHEYFDPGQLGSGVKLAEILSSSKPGQALLLLLTETEDGSSDGVMGRWVGDRIALVGDYAERGDLAQEDNADLIWYLTYEEEERVRTVQHLVQRGETERAKRLLTAQPYRDITPDVVALLSDAWHGPLSAGWALANPSRHEVVRPSGFGVVSTLKDIVDSPFLGPALIVLAAAQREVRGGGDLDMDENWHGPERDERKYAVRPAPMPRGYPAIARRTIGRWAGHPILVTRYWRGYRDITSEARKVLRHELHWMW